MGGENDGQRNEDPSTISGGYQRKQSFVPQISSMDRRLGTPIGPPRMQGKQVEGVSGPMRPGGCKDKSRIGIQNLAYEES